MPLSDGSIEGLLEEGVVEGVEDPELQVQPASLDVRLGRKVVMFSETRGSAPTYNPAAGEFAGSEAHRRCCGNMVLPVGGSVDLAPGDRMLAPTAEQLDMPDDLVARVEGRSSLGRLFVVVHATAGYVDPGFRGQVTLEVENRAPFTVRLIEGMRVAQLVFERTDEPAERPYGDPDRQSKYQGQEGAAASRIGPPESDPNGG